MAEKTSNYKLNKPLESDYYDINISNNNMDVIDRTLYAKVDKVEGKGLSSNDFTNDDKNKLDNTIRCITLTLPNLSWSKNGTVFTLTVADSRIKESDNPLLLPVLPSNNELAALKAYKKNFAYLLDGMTANGSITLRAIKKPVIDLNVVLKGA